MLPPDARPSEAQIRDFVHAFYEEVRADPLLGPVFEGRLGDDWEAHLDKMVDFWSTILHASGRYRGHPVPVHQGIPEITRAHYDRWLELFDETLERVLDPVQAADVGGRAKRMRLVLDRAPSSGPTG